MSGLAGLPALMWAGMMDMTLSGWVNSVLNLIAVACITIKLFCYAQNKGLTERLGLGLMAGGRMMVLAQIVVNSGQIWRTPTPFDGWSTAVFLIGTIMFFGTRIVIHRWSNWRQPRVMRRSIEQARSGQ